MPQAQQQPLRPSNKQNQHQGGWSFGDEAGQWQTSAQAAYALPGSRVVPQAPAYRIVHNEPHNVITGQSYGGATQENVEGGLNLMRK